MCALGHACLIHSFTFRRSKENKKQRRKKAREPRVAFITKSEIDHLEDGCRWCKYGQKAVKNSTYPRSYYRCTAARCGVKKRVERGGAGGAFIRSAVAGGFRHPDLLGAAACATIDDYAGTPSGFLPLLPAGGIGGGGGGGGLLRPSMWLLLQEPQHHRARSSQLAAVDACGGVLDFIRSIPR
ncbi:WRKY transcription factor 23-like [Miscanthus floridulus]|uniref:WRKY transcription factor 23-like n=1 Tax=Miscanthus floridulus TaxID=154761 RepID=UPI003458F69C